METRSLYTLTLDGGYTIHLDCFYPSPKGNSPLYFQIHYPTPIGEIIIGVGKYFHEDYTDITWSDSSREITVEIKDEIVRKIKKFFSPTNKKEATIEHLQYIIRLTDAEYTSNGDRVPLYIKEIKQNLITLRKKIEQL